MAPTRTPLAIGDVAPGSYGAACGVRAGSARARVARAAARARLAAYAALALFLTLFLPWYQVTLIASARTKLESASVSVTGWGAFSFVEAAVLLVAAAF